MNPAQYKVCPTCAEPALLNETVCAKCGHRYRTIFVTPDPTQVFNAPLHVLPLAPLSSKKASNLKGCAFLAGIAVLLVVVTSLLALIPKPVTSEVKGVDPDTGQYYDHVLHRDEEIAQTEPMGPAVRAAFNRIKVGTDPSTIATAVDGSQCMLRKQSEFAYAFSDGDLSIVIMNGKIAMVSASGIPAEARAYPQIQSAYANEHGAEVRPVPPDNLAP